MPNPRRRLLDDAVRKSNPYSSTIDQAMERLEAIERALTQELPKVLQMAGRQKQYKRRVIRKGYAANTDSQGWYYQVPEGRLWTLKRITLIGDTAGAYGLFIGQPDASGLRELMMASQAVTFNNGATGSTYADAFSNDLFARGGDFIFIQYIGAAGAATSHTIVVTLEVEQDIPVKRDFSEETNLAIQVEAPLETERDIIDGAQTGLTGDRPELVEHFSPDTEQDMEGDGLYVTHTQEETEEGQTALIPDVAAHLPPHLR